MSPESAGHRCIEPMSATDWSARVSENGEARQELQTLAAIESERVEPSEAGGRRRRDLSANESSERRM
jgi:hypothetical protein